MPSYETLDTIADAYTPLLALAALMLLLHPLWGLQWQVFGARMSRLVAGALVAYGLMFLDNRLGIWPKLGLDYSTHTAVALVLVMFLAMYSRRVRLPGWLSLFAYLLLMLYQQYHTVGDIASTLVAVGALYIPAVYPMHRNRQPAA